MLNVVSKERRLPVGATVKASHSHEARKPSKVETAIVLLMVLRSVYVYSISAAQTHQKSLLGAEEASICGDDCVVTATAAPGGSSSSGPPVTFSPRVFSALVLTNRESIS